MISEQDALSKLREDMRSMKANGGPPPNCGVVDLPDEILAKLRIWFDGTCLECNKTPHDVAEEIGIEIREKEKEEFCYCDIDRSASTVEKMMAELNHPDY
jgi:hypothetical protein